MRKMRQLGRSWEEGEDGGEGQGDQRATGSMIGRSHSQRLKNQTLNPTSWGQGGHCLSQMIGRGAGRSRGWRLSLGTKRMREGLTVAAGGEREAWDGCQDEHQVEGSRVEV